MSDSHPAVLTLGQTRARNFPLIMIVGREANSKEPKVYGHGPYDFDSEEKRRCAFWSTSYGIAGSTIGLTSGELKRVCIARDVSPLIYVDGLPITIPNAVRNKAPFRLAVPEAVLREHVEHVFSHEDLIARVKLVIISGHEDASFKKPREIYREACVAHGLPVAEVSFFFGNNVPKIQAELKPHDVSRMKDVMEQFRRDDRSRSSYRR